MNFLFFDCECSKCSKTTSKLCSFGYVLTDSNLNIIKKEDLLINPLEFDDLIMDGVIAYSKEELLKHKEFDSYYPYIKLLLTDPNNIVIGQSVTNDATFINNACKEYHLDALEYPLYDFARIFEFAFNNQDYLNLEKEGEILGTPITQGIKHTSLNDALLTYECFKNLANKLDLKYLTMLKKYRGYVGLSKDYKVKTILDFKHVSNNMSKKSNNKNRFIIFLQNCKRMKKDSNILLHKKINIGYDFEKVNYREMIYIAQLIKNLGGQYEISPTKSDYYVSIIGEHDLERLNIKKYEKIFNISEFLELIGFDKAQVYNFYDFVINKDLLLTKSEKEEKRYIKEVGLDRIKRIKFY